MRFIGNKENLVEKTYQVLQSKNIKGNSFFDFFAGTSNVGRYFKKQGYQVFSSDLLYFSYVLQKAYIENNTEVQFEKLLPTLTGLVELVEFNYLRFKSNSNGESSTKKIIQEQLYILTK